MPDAERTPLVIPAELEAFQEAQRKINRAFEEADRIPAEIPDREVLGEASDALKALRLARKDADQARKDEKAPHIEAGRSIDAAFNELGEASRGREKSLEDRVLAFTRNEQEEREAERKRIEKRQAERQARENKRAEEEGRRSRHVPAPPPPPPPPRGARGGFSKTTPRKVWKYEITDEAKLPDEYLVKTPDRRKIKAAVEAGLVVEGVRAWQEDEVAVR